jgi:hypothetical protein
MNGGRFAFNFIAAWIDRIRQRRRVKRRLREFGIEEDSMAIDLGTRTSTNALVGGGLFSQGYLLLVQMLPGQGEFEQLLLQPEAVAFAAVLFATVVARFSKTPEQPKVL